jgi:hypothetical protein
MDSLLAVLEVATGFGLFELEFFVDGSPDCFEVPESAYLDVLDVGRPSCLDEVALGVLRAEPALLRFFFDCLLEACSSCLENSSSTLASFLRSRSDISAVPLAE